MSNGKDLNKKQRGNSRKKANTILCEFFRKWMQIVCVRRTSNIQLILNGLTINVVVLFVLGIHRWRFLCCDCWKTRRAPSAGENQIFLCYFLPTLEVHLVYTFILMRLVCGNYFAGPFRGWTLVHLSGWTTFWAHLCKLHGGLICVAFGLSVTKTQTK